MLLRPLFSIALLATTLLLTTTDVQAKTLPGDGPDAGKTVVYRDTWGVPHIYAPTVEAGLYAMGWTQAEDRPEEMLKNFARAIGESARFDGEGGVLSDLRSQMWRHYDICKENAGKLKPELLAQLEAYAQGVTDFYAANPADKPAWWGDRPVDAYMCMAFGRYFLYNWSVDDAYEDLKRGGIEPGFDPMPRASNQFAVSKQRSAEGAPILYIDPHLGWFGVSRFWEFRIHAGELVGSGFSLPGMPYIGLGHNENVAWSMTTGGPDTADIYVLELHPDDPTKYKYDDEWRTLEKRVVSIPVKDAEAKTFDVYDSHYGPVVALRGGKAYVAKTAYADCVEGTEAWYLLNMAKDYTGVIAATETHMFFPQNIMAADTAGNTYYQRTGRIPQRPAGPDWSRPVDGSKSANEWQGLIPVSDHVQILNPEHGYMQNCNIPPDAMMVHSPLTPDKYLPEVFSDLGYGERGGWTNQRGARAVELLSQDDSVTAEEAIQYALDLHPYGSERWVRVLLKAHEVFGSAFESDADYVEGIKDIKAWDQRLANDSTGALKYFYWRRQLVDDHGQSAVDSAAKLIDPWYAIVKGEKPVEDLPLGDDELQAALSSFSGAMTRIKMDYGKLSVAYGDKFRVGRDDKSWPSAGGGDRNLGMVTLRNTNYSKEREDKTRWGVSGQTSTQIAVLTKPIQSWTQPPIGQSDRPDSPHYMDQAEKVYSKCIMKPSWWLPAELSDHVASRTVLEKAPS